MTNFRNDPTHQVWVPAQWPMEGCEQLVNGMGLRCSLCGQNMLGTVVKGGESPQQLSDAVEAHQKACQAAEK